VDANAASCCVAQLALPAPDDHFRSWSLEPGSYGAAIPGSLGSQNSGYTETHPAKSLENPQKSASGASR
jgi:hypothetical protein